MRCSETGDRLIGRTSDAGCETAGLEIGLERSTIEACNGLGKLSSSHHVCSK